MASYIITEPLARSLGLPEPSARLFLSLFLVYPIAVLFRLAVANRSSTVQHVFISASGMWIVYFNIGSDIWHCLLDVFLVYVVLVTLGGSALSVGLVWLITLFHLFVGYTITAMSSGSYTVTWTLPLCVMMLKLIGLTTDMYEAHHNIGSPSERVVSVPSLLEILGFCFYYSGVLVGPQILFQRYRKFTSGKLYDINSTRSCVPAALYRLFLGLLFSALYVVLGGMFPVRNLIAEGFANKPMWEKLVVVFFTGKFNVWRYTLVWLIAEGSCIMTGISFKSVDEAGNADWSAVRNVNVWNFETSTTLQGVIESFNIGTNQWVSRYVFKQLKWLQNKTVSHVLSLLFITLWHGPRPGFALTFSLEFFCIVAERKFIDAMKRLLKGDTNSFSWPIQLLLLSSGYVLRNLIMNYCLLLFLLLNWRDCWKFMLSVHFYGHVLVFMWLLVSAFGSTDKKTKLS